MTKPNKPQWEQEFNGLFDINKGVKFPQVFENGKYTDVVPVAAVREFISDQIAKAEKRGLERAIELVPKKLEEDIIGLVLEDTSISIDMLNNICRDMHNTCRNKMLKNLKKELDDEPEEN